MFTCTTSAMNSIISGSGYSYRTNLAGVSGICWLFCQPHRNDLSHAGHCTRLARCSCEPAAISVPSHACNVWSRVGGTAGFR